MSEAPEPFIGIHDDVINVRRSWEGHHNGKMLAWVLDLDEKDVPEFIDSYHRDDRGIGWFSVPREKVDLDWLARRVKELFLQVDVKCAHSGPPCPIHNVDTRWRDEAMRKQFDF